MWYFVVCGYLLNMLLLFICKVMSDSFWAPRLQYARLLCPPPSPTVCSNSHPLSPCCYLTMSYFAALFFCLQSFPASGSFSMRWIFASGSQSIRTSASAPGLPKNIQGWFPLRLTGLISLLSEGLSRVFSTTTVRKHQFFGTQPSLRSNSHIGTWLHTQ